MRRTIISLSKFLFVVFVVSGLCVASLPLPAMAEPPTPTPPHPRLRYEGLEEWPHRALTTLQTAPQGNVASAQLAAWSKLVFQSYRDGNWEIYLANGDGSSQTRLTYDGAADIQPRLNRGCTRIAFASKRTGNYEIFTMNPDGSGLTRLTANGTDDVEPFWSPDGTKIAFQAYRDGQAEIYVMNTDGSGQARLTWDGAYDGEPAWSPGGTRIAFTSKRSGGYAIWVMNADGSGQMQLSTQPYSENPAWSPDGTQIAYDSDGNGDGWQELWLMNADGSNQRQVYDPGEYQTDAWACSWSPDGRYVAFTRISWIYYEGNWYWTEAYLDAWDNLNPWNTVRLSGQGTDLYPDWQTTDAWAPTSSVNALPAQSPGPFTVRWSGFDNGTSGLKSYDVQVKDGTGGAWTDWQMGTMATSASYPGLGGHIYYFRSRARDNAYNVEPWPPDYDTFTMVEALPPRTAVEPLSAYSRGEITVRWGGSDPGGSGIQTYDVQYRDTGGGSWTDWQIGTTSTSATFFGTAGHTYYFRSRARDKAQNIEPWPSGDGDTSTTLYTWAVTGTVRDNAGTPATGAVVTTTPGALVVIPSGVGGAYAAYVVADAATYTTTWAKSGYGALPATDFAADQDARVDVVLPPNDNVVRNWGFESGNLEAGDWLASGVITPVVTDTLKHTGNYAALLDWQPFAFAPPVDISKNPDLSSDPQLAVDEGGAVHVVWNSPEEIYYARRGSDGIWSSPLNISNNSGYSGWPQLAVDGSGAVHVVWADNTYGNYNIYYAQRGSDGIWSSPENISSNSGESHYPQLAVDVDGAIHVVWQGGSYGYKKIYYSRRGSGGTWSSPQALSNNSSDSDDQQLAVDKTGVVHVVWSHVVYPIYVSENWEIYYVRRGRDGNWSAPMNISNNLGYSRMPRLVVDGRGAVHLVWHDQVQISGEYDIYYAERGSDGVWFSPQNISNSPGESMFPQLVVDGHGIIHVVWSESGTGIYYARRESNGIWSTPQIISRSWGAFGLAGDRNQGAHLIWENGGIYYMGPAPAERTGDSSIAQTVTVPIPMSTPTLSFLYQLRGASAASGSWFNVQVDNGITATTLFSTTTSTNDWTHRWFDLTPWAGQTVTVTFNIHQTASYPFAWAYLDEVSIGSAYPDLWVTKDGPIARPAGEQIVYAIAYGNRGGAAASGVRITDTLPTELSFVDASPPPVTTLPLIWEVGDVPAKSGPFTITVTATVDPAAPLFTTLTNTASIGAVSPELETFNNTAQAATFIGHRIYLPVVMKGYYE